MEQRAVLRPYLDKLDKERERRGHRFGRSAEESNIYGQRARAGARGRARVTRVVERRVQRAVTAATRAVDRPWRRTFLGCSFTARGPTRRRVSHKARKACTQEVRHRTSRTRGVSLPRVGSDLRQSLTGGAASCGCAEGQSPRKERDSWGRRRLRGSVWKPWGRRRSRELRHRGVSRDLAWNTGTSAHGPWR